MENRMLNKILIALIVVMSVIIIIMVNLIIRNESARNYYNLNPIKNVTWKNSYEGTSLLIENNLINLEINSEKVYRDKKYKFNTMTGEIKAEGVETPELYVRSVSDNQLVIWYKEAEYRLNKIVVAK